MFQLRVCLLEWEGTRELIHPEEQWVLCVEEDILQASMLVTWEESTQQLLQEQHNVLSKLLGVLSSLQKHPGPNHGYSQSWGVRGWETEGIKTPVHFWGCLGLMTALMTLHTGTTVSLAGLLAAGGRPSAEEARDPTSFICYLWTWSSLGWTQGAP